MFAGQLATTRLDAAIPFVAVHGLCANRPAHPWEPAFEDLREPVHVDRRRILEPVHVRQLHGQTPTRHAEESRPGRLGMRLTKRDAASVICDPLTSRLRRCFSREMARMARSPNGILATLSSSSRVSFQIDFNDAIRNQSPPSSTRASRNSPIGRLIPEHQFRWISAVVR